MELLIYPFPLFSRWNFFSPNFKFLFTYWITCGNRLLGESILRVEVNSGESLSVYEHGLSNAEKFEPLAFLWYGPFLLEYGFVFLIPFFAIRMIEEKEKRQKVIFIFYKWKNELKILNSNN